MAFVTGRVRVCYRCGCDAQLKTVRESFDERDRIWVGEVWCGWCNCAMLYSRRAETAEELATAKRGPSA